METTKKRKRDGELPRITYDAPTRTFDRLFKEDSLDALKDVVRKKLNVSSSVPVHLSQLRDGKLVDLDDDEDFEAFSASVYSASAVKVNVILGENQAFPAPSKMEPSLSSSKKRKRAKKRKSNAALPEEVTPPESSLENLRPSKKRRVSFVEGQRELTETPRKNDKKSTTGDIVAESVQSVQERLAVTNEAETSEPSAEKKKKKKKKRQETPPDYDMEERETIQPEGDQSTSGKKESKKTTTSDDSSTDNPVLSPIDAAVNKSSDEAPQTKKSKKRARTGTPEINDEGVAASLPSTEIMTPGHSRDKGNAERSSKKSKRKHTDNIDSETPTPVPVADAASKSTKPKSKFQPSMTQPPTQEELTIEFTNKSKKSRKKKDEVAAEASDNSTPQAPKPNEVAPPSERPYKKPATSKKPKKSTSQLTEVASSEDPTSEKHEGEVLAKKSKKLKQKTDSNDPKEAPEMPSKKKSGRPLAQPTDAITPQSSAALPVEIKVKATSATSQKDKKALKDSEVGMLPETSADKNITTDKDDASRPLPPVDAKTPKKASKKKKDLADSVEPASAAQEKSSENETDAQNTSQIDMKEAARLALQAFLNRKLEQAKDAGQNPSPSVVVQSEPAIAPAQPAPKGKDTQKKANKNPASSSSVVQSADAPALAPVQPAPKDKGTQQEAKKSSTTTATAAQEKPSAPSTCPVCDESPFHFRTKCPIIKAGIKSMRKRIAELQADTTEENNAERSKIIAELQVIIERKRKKPKTSEAVKPISPPEIPLEKEVGTGLASTSVDPKSPVTTLPLSVQPSLTQPPPTQPPPTQPPPIQPPPTQPRTQLAASIHAPSSNKAANTSLRNVFQGPRKIAEGPLRPDFLGLGDVSLYTDQDLEVLIRGPKVSLKDVPSSDNEDESEEEQEVALEEEEELAIKAPRNASWTKYPSSSDEGEGEEDSPTGSVLSGSSLGQRSMVQPAPDRDSSAGTDEVPTGIMSFQEVDAEGSSRELDRTGDIAVNDAVAADLAPLNPRVLSQETRHGNEKEVDSDTAVASQAESPGPESNVQGQSATPPPFPPVEKDKPDPIEPSEGPPASQPETIVSEDERPMESTPKVVVAVRTRSQRNKAPASDNGEPRVTQQPPSHHNTHEVEEVIKPTRKTRSLTRISEIPVPPNPSIRVIRPAPTSRTRRQLAQEESQEREATPVAEATETNARPRRSTAATKAAAAKTPAKTSAKAGKTPAKPTTKAPATILAKAVTTNNARTRSKSAVLPADPEQDELSQANDTFVISQGKKGNTNGVGNGKTSAKSLVISPAESEEARQGNDAAPPETEDALAPWAVLQESIPSRVDTETPGMVDELLSSPNTRPAPSPRDLNRKGQKANGSSPEPLFVPADSQQSFPYSQYPDLLAGAQGAAFPNESDDDEEDEVDKVVRPSVPARQASRFRGLTEIASQPAVFIQRLSQQLTKESAQDFYGRGGQESEESDSGTDSEAEAKEVASHIPAGRRAGVSTGKKK